MRDTCSPGDIVPLYCVSCCLCHVFDSVPFFHVLKFMCSTFAVLMCIVVFCIVLISSNVHINCQKVLQTWECQNPLYCFFLLKTDYSYFIVGFVRRKFELYVLAVSFSSSHSRCRCFFFVLLLWICALTSLWCFSMK